MRMPNWLRKLEHNLHEYKWYRRWYGGRWELWYVDFVGNEVWHNSLQLPNMRMWNGKPSPLCRGMCLEVEDYTSILYYHLHGDIDE